MLFNSYEFLLVFLPAALLVSALVDGVPVLRTWTLIALSLIFYSYWDVRFLPLMVGSILLNWWAANLYFATRRHAIITGAIVANLGVLGLFKYANFFADNIAALTGLQAEHFALVLPLGISFFTFHHIMYLVDIGRKRAPLYSLDRYALYICFFTQAIAGPIARWSEVMDQFGGRIFAPGWERRWAAGTTLVVLGLAQKVLIADPLSRAIDPIYAAALQGPVRDGSAWMALAFVFQGFFDFSGYSDIAIGLALIFGIALPRNFDAPFRSTSILDLWRRWHMTLARFLRDYVFSVLANVPIGGRKRRIERMLAALVVTMALCGLWHGAGWTYVIWGTLQGFGMLFAIIWGRYVSSPPALVGWAATVGFFMITGVFFRAGSLEAVWHIYEGLAILPNSFPPSGWRDLLAAVICAIVLPPSHEICRRLTERPRLAVAVALAALGIAVLLAMNEHDAQTFVYFQF